MSLTILYDQTTVLVQKPLDAMQVRELFGSVCHVGSVGPNFSFSDALPQPGENGESVYMMYGREKPLGRGFCLFVPADYSPLRLVTPLPTTGHDLDDFFAVTHLLGHYLQAREFLTEERQSFPLEGISVFCEEMKSDNRMMVKDFADERPGFAVSGVKYPLHMTGEFCGQLAQMDPPASEFAFSQCLALKQEEDYYYLNPNYYRNTDTGQPMAIYALSEGVDSIIPKEPFIPYGAGPFGEEAVEVWKVALIQNGAEAEVLGTIPYQNFLGALSEREKQEFDDVHFLLRGLPLARLRELASLGETLPQ